MWMGKAENKGWNECHIGILNILWKSIRISPGQFRTGLITNWSLQTRPRLYSSIAWSETNFTQNCKYQNCSLWSLPHHNLQKAKLLIICRQHYLMRIPVLQTNTQKIWMFVSPSGWTHSRSLWEPLQMFSHKNLNPTASNRWQLPVRAWFVNTLQMYHSLISNPRRVVKGLVTLGRFP